MLLALGEIKQIGKKGTIYPHWALITREEERDLSFHASLYFCFEMCLIFFEVSHFRMMFDLF